MDEMLLSAKRIIAEEERKQAGQQSTTTSKKDNNGKKVITEIRMVWQLRRMITMSIASESLHPSNIKFENQSGRLH